jgi:hypothetical protein
MSDKKQRVSYDLNAETGTLTVKYGNEQGTLTLFPELEAVTGQLALEGLRGFLQRYSAKVDEDEKLAAIEEGYNHLVDVGMAAFERKPPFGGQRGPRGPKKADKIAALAVLKGATVDAVKEVLSGMDKAEQNRVLNNPKVLAKLEEMNTSPEGLDLTV